MTIETTLLVAVVFLIAGGAKGLAGIGLPTVAISLMSQFVDPRLAISIALGPLFFTNFWQMWRSGDIWQTVLEYKNCILSLGLALYISSQFALSFSTQTIVLILGLVVCLFSLSSLLYRPPFLADEHAKKWQVIVGLTGGALGGLTAIWGPPVLMYLIARRVDKEQFVRVVGVILTFGAIPLIWSYWRGGHFQGDIALVSVMMVVPAIAGFAVGEYFRHRINATAFQKMLLVMFFLLGLNLIRRAVF